MLSNGRHSNKIDPPFCNSDVLFTSLFLQDTYIGGKRRVCVMKTVRVGSSLDIISATRFFPSFLGKSPEMRSAAYRAKVIPLSRGKHLLHLFVFFMCLCVLFMAAVRKMGCWVKRLCDNNAFIFPFPAFLCIFFPPLCYSASPVSAFLFPFLYIYGVFVCLYVMSAYAFIRILKQCPFVIAAAVLCDEISGVNIVLFGVSATLCVNLVRVLRDNWNWGCRDMLSFCI